MQARIAGTNFARQAALLLIDEDGSLNLSYAADLLEELRDTSKYTDLSLNHRANVIRTLETMISAVGIKNIVNSICRYPHKLPKGPALDMVRAALDLPMDAPVDAAAARRFALMCLLDHMRQQDEVVTCFSTAPAIILHNDYPEHVAFHMKSLLENCCLKFGEMEVPLNTRLGYADAERKLTIDSGHMCHVDVDADSKRQTANYHLHESIPVRAALRKLGIAEDDMENTVMFALDLMGRGEQDKFTFSCKKLLEIVVLSKNEDKDAARQDLDDALHAYAMASGGPLRVWESTLATCAEMTASTEHVRRLADFLFKNILDPYLGPVQQGLLGRLIDESRQWFYAEIRDHLFLEFDANVSRHGTMDDGKTNRGGFVLCRKGPNDLLQPEPLRSERIDSQEKFQQALLKLLQFAHGEVLNSVDGTITDDDTFARCMEMLKDIFGAMEHRISKFDILDEFNRQPDLPANERPYRGEALRASSPLWQPRGSFCDGLLGLLGSSVVMEEEIARDWPINDDDNLLVNAMVTDVLKFICSSTYRMSEELSLRAEHGGRGLMIPVKNDVHTCLLIPPPDILQGKLAHHWIEEKLTKPAMEFFEAERHDPPISLIFGRLLRDVGPTVSSDLKRRIYENAKYENGAWHYSISTIHRVLNESQGLYRGVAAALKELEEAFVSRLPDPEILVDTNWMDAKGNPRYMAARYNPFKGRLELVFCNKDGGDCEPVKSQWLKGRWKVFQPLSPPPLPTLPI